MAARETTDRPNADRKAEDEIRYRGRILAREATLPYCPSSTTEVSDRAVGTFGRSEVDDGEERQDCEQEKRRENFRATDVTKEKDGDQRTETRSNTQIGDQSDLTLHETSIQTEDDSHREEKRVDESNQNQRQRKNHSDESCEENSKGSNRETKEDDQLTAEKKKQKSQTLSKSGESSAREGQPETELAQPNVSGSTSHSQLPHTSSSSPFALSSASGGGNLSDYNRLGDDAVNNNDGNGEVCRRVAYQQSDGGVRTPTNDSNEDRSSDKIEVDGGENNCGDHHGDSVKGSSPNSAFPLQTRSANSLLAGCDSDWELLGKVEKVDEDGDRSREKQVVDWKREEEVSNEALKVDVAIKEKRADEKSPCQTGGESSGGEVEKSSIRTSGRVEKSPIDTDDKSHIPGVSTPIPIPTASSPVLVKSCSTEVLQSNSDNESGENGHCFAPGSWPRRHEDLFDDGRQVWDAEEDEYGTSVDPVDFKNARTGRRRSSSVDGPAKKWEDRESDGSEFEDADGMGNVTEMRSRLMAEASSRDFQQRQGSAASKAEGFASDDEDFFDALDHQVEQEFEVALPHSKDKLHRRTGSDMSMDSVANDMSSESESEGSVNEARVYTTKANSPKKTLQGQVKRDHKRQGSQDKIRPPRSSAASHDSAGAMVSRRKRRTWIKEKPNISLNLWSVMKNCIGKELSKIPMPVNFSEPLSMLQRLTEELEYSEILDNAALCDDSCEQLAYVAAFTVSAYATTLFRTGKPFNPLLGETYEFDRTDDYGWRSLAEQVSHHPPTLATHAEGRGWTMWQEFTMTTKFRGRYLQIIPMGIAHLSFSKSGSMYTWRKVTTTVHNIIVGRLWVDNQGEMDITNHTTGDKCHLKYSPYSYFSKEPPRKVSGVVTDSKENARWVLTGNWCTKMEGAPIIHTEESNKGKPVFETGPHKQLWKVRPPPNGAERIYYFSQLAIEMNEPEEGVAPTDTRNRPDQRMMEDGMWDEANRLKFLLEEKQRSARRQREAEVEKLKMQGEDYFHHRIVESSLENKVYLPTWFNKELDPVTGTVLHIFNNKYWDHKVQQDWSCCPDIYL
ncbi:uncharacterized protein [Littorina saxatilis]|uniref:uncharacterized protein isoform X2 n=1 Tax=Littorina saxatilis TaxID=31220 RepID=UPI0038B435C1